MADKPNAPHLLAGEYSEEIALHYLQQQGLSLLERNFRSRHGELDLIMRATNCLVVVEVRYRSSPKFGGAAATITPGKQRRIIKTTQVLLQQRSIYRKLPVRFDVVAISGHLDAAKIEWLPRAFSVDGII
jgi:putative endonuclease